jgi:hypothetical protein
MSVNIKCSLQSSKGSEATTSKANTKYFMPFAQAQKQKQ